MDQTCEDIDEMFSNLLGEMDLLTQSLAIETTKSTAAIDTETEPNFAFGFKDLNESLNALEENDLDALMADLVANSSASFPYADGVSSHYYNFTDTLPTGSTDDLSYLPPPPPPSAWDLPPPPPDPVEPMTQDDSRAKADKIKDALGKMKEAKVKKLIIKVHMTDGSTKTLMVNELQTIRDVIDNLFEKSHCDCSVEWCLYEENPELQLERFFEDHENIVDILSDWPRDSANIIHFQKKNEKYAVFKNPQNFYLARKGSADMKDMNEKNKVSLLEQSFCGASVVVPDLEAAFYLKEDGKKSWKKRYFLLRASGIYYVPKGKTKTSRDLACFIQFDNVNVYYGTQYKVKYKAPTDHCFVLKHPQIQKESQYIKYLCCDDPWVLHQWVTGIRIAKYGKTLYENYKTAVQKAGLASHWSTLSNSSVSSTTGTAQGNGQISQNVPNVSSSFTDAWKRGEETKSTKLNEITKPEHKNSPPTLTKKPPPAPLRKSSTAHVVATPPLPIKAKSLHSDILPPPPEYPAAEESEWGNDFLPPPPPDFSDAPPDFLPPPPPSFLSATEYPPAPPQLTEVADISAHMAPPPPPPSVATAPPQLPVKKLPPNPPKRRDSKGAMSRELNNTNANGGQIDFMSDLAKALQKKRGTTS
ncbi:amyloid beta A4 precursor protein-binding family B member 1-interacting protein [Pseudophryne corroboree]|uniref:amyloid beta A4 precursor protein-binding family B member 1-interacting protein n=1 Tax=Pseudophryne corroboree TaxID=495146 RepID=UPI003081C4D2